MLAGALWSPAIDRRPLLPPFPRPLSLVLPCRLRRDFSLRVTRLHYVLAVRHRPPSTQCKLSPTPHLSPPPRPVWPATAYTSSVPRCCSTCHAAAYAVASNNAGYTCSSPAPSSLAPADIHARTHLHIQRCHSQSLSRTTAPTTPFVLHARLRARRPAACRVRGRRRQPGWPRAHSARDGDVGSASPGRRHPGRGQAVAHPAAAVPGVLHRACAVVGRQMLLVVCEGGRQHIRGGEQKRGCVFLGSGVEAEAHGGVFGGVMGEFSACLRPYGRRLMGTGC